MNEVIQTILNRRSCKQYLDRPVPEELLDQVLLAGTYAANGRGKQAGRIVALTRPQDVAALERLNARALGNRSPPLLWRAGGAGSPGGSFGLHRRGRWKSRHPGNMLLAAQSLGLGCLLDPPCPGGIRQPGGQSVAGQMGRHWRLPRRGPLHSGLSSHKSPGGCTPKREFCYKSLNLKLQNRQTADILKSSQ